MEKQEQKPTISVLQLAGENNAFYLFTEGSWISRQYTYQQAINIFKKLVPEKNISEIVDEVRDALPVTFEYSPILDESMKLRKTPRGDFTFNMYVAAEWMDKTRGSKKEESIRDLYIPFFHYLFQDDKKLVAEVINWMANVVQGKRNHLILTLLGPPGVGKSSFAAVLEHLIGSDNFHRCYQVPEPREATFRQVIHWREALVQGATDYRALVALYGEHTSILLTTSSEGAIVPAPLDQRLWIVECGQSSGRLNPYDMATLTDPVNIRALGLYLQTQKAKVLTTLPRTESRARILNRTLEPWERKFLTVYCGAVKKKGDVVTFEEATRWLEHQGAEVSLTPDHFRALQSRAQEIKEAAPRLSKVFGLFNLHSPNEGEVGDYSLEITGSPIL